MRGFTLALLSFLLACGGAAAPARAEDPAPDAAKVLAKIDAKVWFADTQEKLASYDCEASSTTSSKGLGASAQPDVSKAKAIGQVRWDVKAEKKTWTAADKQDVPPGSWAPSCGPWTLTNLMRLEVELFARPLAPRFTEAAFERSVAAEGDGWRLTLKPKQRLGEGEPQPLAPVVTRLELVVDADGLPLKGVLGLDQGFMQEDGALGFEFAAEGTRQRIVKITNTLSSANLKVRPALTFVHTKQGEFLLLTEVQCRVPMGDLSPALARMPGGDMLSALLYRKYVAKKVS